MHPFQVFASVLWLFAILGMAPAGAAGDLALKRVLLSTGGVGYFEYEADVVGDAELTLQVGLDQVDDVLKSIVVYDDDGAVGSIDLPGKTPLREVFRELPFGQDALDSPVALLNTLRGAEVEVRGARALKGRILSIEPETRTLPDGNGTIVRHRLTLMTANGIRQLVLEETDLLEFSDPDLQADIDRALKALVELGERDRRTLKVSLKGEGARTVRVAYLVEAPLWKTSYRLTMPDDPLASSADIQGWATVENLSGEDWNSVELTLVSGNPVTFRQALYDTYYVDRTEVPVEVLGRLMPRSDEGTVSAEAASESLPSAPRQAAKVRSRLQAFGGADMAAAAPMMAEASESAPTPDAARILASESTEATSYVLFRHPQPVSVGNGYSLSIPIVARPFKADRLALYQPGTHETHPLAAIDLTNDSDTALPPGILTLYERGADGRVAYVGDAILKTVPASEKRLLSYALDQSIRIDREDRDTNRIATAKIAKGLLVLTHRRRLETIYRIEAAAKDARRLVIEHPRVAGWELVEPASAGVEMTADHYRIGQNLKAGEKIVLKVALERTDRETVSLSTLSLGQIQYYASAKELQPAQRKAIAALAEKLQAVEDARTIVSREEQELQELLNEQERLSNTLRTVPENSDLFQRYLKTMTANEDALTALRQGLEAARKQVAEAERAMLDYARSLDM